MIISIEKIFHISLDAMSKEDHYYSFDSGTLLY